MILDADPKAVLDPWLHGEEPRRCPKNTEAVCIYDVVHMLDSNQEAVFYKKYRGREELWIVPISQYPIEGKQYICHLESLTGFLSENTYGCAVTRSLDSDAPRGAKHLFTQLILSRRGHAWPGDFFVAGSISAEDYRDLIASIEEAIDERSSKAEDSRPAIVEVAEEQGLGPHPEGSSPGNWLARCPGTSHSLYLAGDEFGCGYCRRKGGADELRRFVEERGERS